MEIIVGMEAQTNEQISQNQRSQNGFSDRLRRLKKYLQDIVERFFGTTRTIPINFLFLGQKNVGVTIAIKKVAKQLFGHAAEISREDCLDQNINEDCFVTWKSNICIPTVNFVEVPAFGSVGNFEHNAKVITALNAYLKNEPKTVPNLIFITASLKDSRFEGANSNFSNMLNCLKYQGNRLTTSSLNNYVLLLTQADSLDIADTLEARKKAYDDQFEKVLGVKPRFVVKIGKENSIIESIHTALASSNSAPIVVTKTIDSTGFTDEGFSKVSRENDDSLCTSYDENHTNVNDDDKHGNKTTEKLDSETAPTDGLKITEKDGYTFIDLDHDGEPNTDSSWSSYIYENLRYYYSSTEVTLVKESEAEMNSLFNAVPNTLITKMTSNNFVGTDIFPEHENMAFFPDHHSFDIKQENHRVYLLGTITLRPQQICNIVNSKSTVVLADGSKIEVKHCSIGDRLLGHKGVGVITKCMAVTLETDPLLKEKSQKNGAEIYLVSKQGEKSLYQFYDIQENKFCLTEDSPTFSGSWWYDTYVYIEVDGGEGALIVDGYVRKCTDQLIE